MFVFADTLLSISTTLAPPAPLVSEAERTRFTDGSR